ncbi:hypothetical protein C8Q72DRAFT_842387, partial [Fomitopsis betulina]
MLAPLLAVCAAIVVCSYLIRCRQRRLLDNTVRNGLLPASPSGFRPGAGAGHVLGKACRPELVDVYLGSAPAEKGRQWSVGSEDGAGEYEEHWWGVVECCYARGRMRSHTQPDADKQTQDAPTIPAFAVSFPKKSAVPVSLCAPPPETAPHRADALRRHRRPPHTHHRARPARGGDRRAHQRYCIQHNRWAGKLALWWAGESAGRQASESVCWRTGNSASGQVGRQVSQQASELAKLSKLANQRAGQSACRPIGVQASP